MKAPYSVAACVVAVLALGAGPITDQKPVTRLINRPTPSPAPASTELLWAWADAVVDARVVGNTVRERFPGSTRLDPDLATEYSFHVSEVLKQSQEHPISRTVSVVFPGGVKEYPDRILEIVQEGFPPPQKGTSLVLFLRWSPSNDSYIPLHGPEGVFDVSGDRVQSPGQSAMARSNAGKSVATFLKELRMTKDKAKCPNL